MSRMVIQVSDSWVAYDGHEWTPLAGDRAAQLADLMKSGEYLYKNEARAHPDYAYDVARLAAEDWGGKIVEYEPAEYTFDPKRIY